MKTNEQNTDSRTIDNQLKYAKFVIETAAVVMGAALGLRILAPGIFKDQEFAPGYINVSESKMEYKDIDGDRKYESVMQYKGRDYLMKYDAKSNTATIVPYTVVKKTINDVVTEQKVIKHVVKQVVDVQKIVPKTIEKIVEQPQN
jgi:hypothetical protein